MVVTWPLLSFSNATLLRPAMSLTLENFHRAPAVGFAGKIFEMFELKMAPEKTIEYPFITYTISESAFFFLNDFRVRSQASRAE